MLLQAYRVNTEGGYVVVVVLSLETESQRHLVVKITASCLQLSFVFLFQSVRK